MIYSMWDDFENGFLWTVVDWASAVNNETSIGRWIPEFMLEKKMSETLSMLPNAEEWEISLDNAKYGSDEGTGKQYGARISSQTLEEHKKIIAAVREIHKNDCNAFSEVYVLDKRVEFLEEKECNLAIIGTDDVISGRRCHRNLPVATRRNGYDNGRVYYNMMKIVGHENLSLESSTLYLYVIEYTRDDGRESSYNYLCGKDDIHAIGPYDGRTFEEKVRWVHDYHLYHLKRIQMLQRPAWEVMARTYEYDLLLGEEDKIEMRNELEQRYSLGERITYGLRDPPTRGWTQSTFLERMARTHDEHKNALKGKRSICNEEHKKLFEWYRQDPFLTGEREDELRAWATNKFNVYVYDIHETEVADPTTIGCKKHKDAFRYWVDECP